MEENRRAQLLLRAADFVRRIRGLDGILRIALVGSLCTRKARPKDIDLLLSPSAIRGKLTYLCSRAALCTAVPHARRPASSARPAAAPAEVL